MSALSPIAEAPPTMTDLARSAQAVLDLQQRRSPLSPAAPWPASEPALNWLPYDETGRQLLATWNDALARLADAERQQLPTTELRAERDAAKLAHDLHRYQQRTQASADFQHRAQELANQSGHPLTVRAEIERCVLTVTDPDGGVCYRQAHASEQAALEQLAGALGVTYRHKVVEYATIAQKQDLIALCNSPYLSAAKKTQILLAINRYTKDELTEKLPLLREALRKREEKQHPGLAVACETKRVGLTHLSKAA